MQQEEDEYDDIPVTDDEDDDDDEEEFEGFQIDLDSIANEDNEDEDITSLFDSLFDD